MTSPPCLECPRPKGRENGKYLIGEAGLAGTAMFRRVPESLSSPTQLALSYLLAKPFEKQRWLPLATRGALPTRCQPSLCKLLWKLLPGSPGFIPQTGRSILLSIRSVTVFRVSGRVNYGQCSSVSWHIYPRCFGASFTI